MTKICLEEKRILCKNMALNLPSLRAKSGLSQEELSERLGFSRQTISAIENGTREMQWSTFSAIALFFLRDSEIKKLMIVMGIMTDVVEELFFPSTTKHCTIGSNGFCCKQG